MSNAALNWAFAQRTGSPGERLVLLVLADAANNSGLAWPSQVTIAAKSGLCRREVQYVLKGLRQRELVTPLGYNKRRRVYHLNRASKPMFEDEDKRNPLRTSEAHSTAHDGSGLAHSTARVTSAIYDKDRRTPLRTNPRNNPKKKPIPEPESPSPAQAPFRAAAKAFVSAPKNERVARLIDLAKSLGIPRSGIAATIVRDHGHGQRVVDLVLKAAQYADGDPWEYMLGVLENEKRSGKPSDSGRQRVGNEDDWKRARKYAAGETDTMA